MRYMISIVGLKISMTHISATNDSDVPRLTPLRCRLTLLEGPRATHETYAAPTSPVRPSVQVEASRLPLPGYLLFVSEDVRFAQSLATQFVRYGYGMESVPSTVEAGTMADRQPPSLILVDRRLPGWQALRQFPLFQTVPMMTIVPAGSGLTDETCIGDLDHGMDSTHVYEENARLLAAKVRALLRRSAWLRKIPAVIRVGQVELDIDRYEVRVAGKANHLPPVQFKLLKYLMESPGIVFRRQELCDHIWGAGYTVEAHTLDVHIFWLRRLLERDQTRRQTIETIRSVGVKLVVNQTSDETIPVIRNKQAGHRNRPVRLAASPAVVTHGLAKKHADPVNGYWSSRQVRRSGRSSS